MKDAWQRFEGPTWIVAATIYGAWSALALYHRSLPFAIAIPIAVYLTAWHSSLQHETIHALRFLPRRVRTAVALPPLGLWYPYAWYRREHLAHHATSDLAGPHDPESFYHAPEAWAQMSASLRALYTINQTFAGRLVLGPALQIGRTYASEIRRFARGDRSNAAAWGGHFLLVGALFVVLARCGVHPLAYVAFVAYPAASLSLVRSFAEHRYADSQRDRTAIVESRSLLSVLFLNNNLHAVHHRHPTLPWFALPTQHRIDRAHSAIATVAPTAGYRAIVRSWLWRPIDSPVGRFPLVPPAP